MFTYMKKITLLAFLCMFGFGGLQGSVSKASEARVLDIYKTSNSDLELTVDNVIVELETMADLVKKAQLKQSLFNFIKKLDADLHSEAAKYQTMPIKSRPADFQSKTNNIIDQRRKIEKNKNYLMEQLLVHCGTAC